ncbi:hypothetical protein H6P81_008019 [Aristolochia fimbriata]|uniref:Uncharacterized protein n=1 Tax=Aristolochia fimbriata TaxID=158543 RepID=A0AAV7F1U6_ARIFI|nr:hypothetical protein H6P81_008019 [Aristolochia fimbriata]
MEEWYQNLQDTHQIFHRALAVWPISGRRPRLCSTANGVAERGSFRGGGGGGEIIHGGGEQLA